MSLEEEQRHTRVMGMLNALLLDVQGLKQKKSIDEIKEEVRKEFIAAVKIDTMTVKGKIFVLEAPGSFTCLDRRARGAFSINGEEVEFEEALSMHDLATGRIDAVRMLFEKVAAGITAEIFKQLCSDKGIAGEAAKMLSYRW